MTPALLMITSMVRPEARKSSAKPRTEDRSPRSSSVTSTEDRLASASFAASVRRAGTTTEAPAPASAFVVSIPMPE